MIREYLRIFLPLTVLEILLVWSDYESLLWVLVKLPCQPAVSEPSWSSVGQLKKQCTKAVETKSLARQGKWCHQMDLEKGSLKTLPQLTLAVTTLQCVHPCVWNSGSHTRSISTEFLHQWLTRLLLPPLLAPLKPALQGLLHCPLCRQNSSKRFLLFIASYRLWLRGDEDIQLRTQVLPENKFGDKKSTISSSPS